MSPENKRLLKPNGYKILEGRQQVGMTQTQLAEAAGLGESTMGNIENGHPCFLQNLKSIHGAFQKHGLVMEFQDMIEKQPNEEIYEKGPGGVWVYRGAVPALRVRVEPELIDRKARIIRIRLEAENRSRVAAAMKQARLQVLEHSTSNIQVLSEWVPFKEDAILPNEQPARWREPMQVMRSTVQITADEVIKTEVLYRTSGAVAVHCGFQVQVEFTIGKALPIATSFTTTAWALVPKISKT
jgi:DNA-binding XRE family transcriptional regulator